MAYQESKGWYLDSGAATEGFLSGPAVERLGIRMKTKNDSQTGRIIHAVDWLQTLAAIAGVAPAGK
jgi:hypothetical protein